MVPSNDSRRLIPYLAQAAVYTFAHNYQFQQRYPANKNRWMIWGWNRLDEVVELINNQFGIRWTQIGLLKRFAIPIEMGKILLGDGNYRNQDLIILWHKNGTNELMLAPYGEATLQRPRSMWDLHTAYIPPGWTRDVFNALEQGCTRAKVDLKDGPGLRKHAKYACDEQGEGVFYMTSGTSTAHKKAG